MSFFSWLFGGDKASSTQATATVEPVVPAALAEPIQTPPVVEPMPAPAPMPVPTPAPVISEPMPEPAPAPVEPPAQDNAAQSNQVQGM